MTEKWRVKKPKPLVAMVLIVALLAALPFLFLVIMLALEPGARLAAAAHPARTAGLVLFPCFAIFPVLVLRGWDWARKVTVLLLWLLAASSAAYAAGLALTIFNAKDTPGTVIALGWAGMIMTGFSIFAARFFSDRLCVLYYCQGVTLDRLRDDLSVLDRKRPSLGAIRRRDAVWALGHTRISSETSELLSLAQEDPDKKIAQRATDLLRAPEG